MDKAQKGFTLIELVVVITILGILAAFAFPRFAALEVEARAATVNGFGGSLRSANALAHSLFLVGSIPVIMEGVTITMLNGYPAGVAGGIDATLVDTSGFTRSDNAASPLLVTFTRDGGPGATCAVTYLEAIPAGVPTITIFDGPC